jgi:hypothetical protein
VRRPNAPGVRKDQRSALSETEISDYSEARHLGSQKNRATKSRRGTTFRERRSSSGDPIRSPTIRDRRSSEDPMFVLNPIDQSNRKVKRLYLKKPFEQLTLKGQQTRLYQEQKQTKIDEKLQFF